MNMITKVVTWIAIIAVGSVTWYQSDQRNCPLAPTACNGTSCCNPHF